MSFHNVSLKSFFDKCSVRATKMSCVEKALPMILFMQLILFIYCAPFEITYKFYYLMISSLKEDENGSIIRHEKGCVPPFSVYLLNSTTARSFSFSLAVKKSGFSMKFALFGLVSKLSLVSLNKEIMFTKLKSLFSQFVEKRIDV